MNENLVRMIAEHHEMELRDDLGPVILEDLDDVPDVQPVGTVTDTYIKWLYGLSYQAAKRHLEQTLRETSDRRPRQLRMDSSLSKELMMAFERSVRERFGIHDEADLTVTRGWKVYTWKRCGCDGDAGRKCSCEHCGDCKTGKGADEERKIQEIVFVLSPESHNDVLASCTMLAMAPTFRLDPTDNHCVRMLIPFTRESYRALKVTARIMTGLFRTCEQVFGWSHGAEPAKDGKPAEESISDRQDPKETA